MQHIGMLAPVEALPERRRHARRARHSPGRPPGPAGADRSRRGAARRCKRPHRHPAEIITIMRHLHERPEVAAEAAERPPAVPVAAAARLGMWGVEPMPSASFSTVALVPASVETAA